ncbi:MAG: VCBS repeat-containing protein [Candidatus Solibacter sp.]|nr:VCBS repeat-containing protein [Candidatus Solibacter sp.]
MNRTIVISLLALGAALALWSVSRPGEVPFEKTLIDGGASETAAFTDINGDGKLDIVSGEYWYEAPKWASHKFRELEFVNGYIDNFADLPLDVNGDGRIDIVSCAGFKNQLVWMENPGKAGGMWKPHEIDKGYFIEFGFLVDLDNDGKAREILPNYLGDKSPIAWYEPANGGFVKHVVTDKPAGHGIGAGDVNGDGRNDIIVQKGWYEAPPDPRAGEWKWHPDFELGDTGFVHVMDVNGDGRADLVTAMGHDYGLFWMEQRLDGKWAKRMIDDTYSQAHAHTLVDVNGDGQLDLLVGKRYMAHDHDVGAREPLGIYWYERLKNARGQVSWVKHVIDYSTRTGAGMHLAAADYDGDGAMDFVAPGKTGLYLFHNLSKRK